MPLLTLLRGLDAAFILACIAPICINLSLAQVSDDGSGPATIMATVDDDHVVRDSEPAQERATPSVPIE